MATEWEDAVIASMTRDQLIVFGKLHEAYGEMKRANAQLRAENGEAAGIVGNSARLISELTDEVDRLKRLAFGAGMALTGVVAVPECGADLMTAQKLIAQMLERKDDL